MRTRALITAIPRAEQHSKPNSAAISGGPGRDYSPEDAGGEPGRSESALQADALQNELSPTQQRLLGILGDPNRAEETNRELAGALHTTEGAVEQQFNRIYRHFGTKSFRGLFRLLASQVIQK